MKHSNRYATRHAARTKKLIAELRRERDVLAGDLRAERLRAETLKAALAATKRLDLSDPNMAGYAVIRLGREDRFPGRPLGISLMIDLERLRLRLFREPNAIDYRQHVDLYLHDIMHKMRAGILAYLQGQGIPC